MTNINRPEPDRSQEIFHKPPATAAFTAVDKAVDEFTKDTGFEGVVGVRVGNRVHVRSVGSANRLGVPHTSEELFPICSITKTFTAVAILRLVEQGRLSLETKVTDILDDPRGIFRNVTIGELLTHTSGIPDLSPDRIDFKQPTDFHSIYNTLDLSQTREVRGSKAYNNFGYVALAAILEKKGGYQKILEEEVFSVAKLNAKAVMHLEELPQSVESLLEDFLQDSPEVRIGAGNIYCSMNDLLAFEKALASGNLLTEPHRNLLYSKHMGFDDIPLEEQFPHMRAKAGGMGDPKHAGPVISTVFYSLPNIDASIAVFCNKQLDEKASWDLGERILSLLN